MKTLKEIEEDIRRAFEIDRMLPSPYPSRASCYLGRLVVTPDTERSYEDIMEDISRSRLNITAEDLKLWDVVFDVWLPSIKKELPRVVVVKRCQGMGWKRLARYLKDKHYTDRNFDRTTLWRIFKSGLNDVLRLNIN